MHVIFLDFIAKKHFTYDRNTLIGFGKGSMALTEKKQAVRRSTMHKVSFDHPVSFRSTKAAPG